MYLNLDIVKNITLDFYDKKFITVDAKQFDRNSRYILVTCTDQGSFFRLDNNDHAAYIRYRKADEYAVFNSCSIMEDGKILVELTEQMLAAPGNCVADLIIVAKEYLSINDFPQITDDGELQEISGSIVSSMKFYVNVIPTPYDNSEIESSYEFNGLNDLLQKANKDYSGLIEDLKESVDEASNYAKEAESFAHGNTGIRENEDVDNAKYYYEQSKSISDNLSDTFVTGIKGNKENTYRKGNVNLTPEDIGALSEEYALNHYAADYIKTTHFETPAGESWFRFGEFKLPSAGGYNVMSDISCTLKIKRRYSSGAPEYHEIKLVNGEGGAKFVNVIDYGRIFFKKIRVVWDNAALKYYLEVYYNHTGTNSVSIGIEFANSPRSGWKWDMLDNVEIVPETTEGIDVLAVGDMSVQFDIGDLLPKNGGELTGLLTPSGGIDKVGYNNFLAYPKDGKYSGSGDFTGYLKIVTQVPFTYDFVQFTVTVYNYSNDTSVDYHIGFCAAQTEKLINCTAFCVGKPGSKLSNLPVRFGVEGKKAAITIGESNTAWNYPQIKIHDVVYRRTSSVETLGEGWTVDITESGLDTVDVTVENTHVAYGMSGSDTVIPTSLPNPYALTFTGGATGSYDGSFAMSVDIPSNTDANVSQTNTTSSADYRVLLSYNANDTTQTVGARKSGKFLANPSTGKFTATSLVAQTGDSTVTFTSNDSTDANATSWTNVTQLATGITHATFFQRVSQMFKNVRYLYKMLGTTDISSIGGGTVTGAINGLSTWNTFSATALSGFSYIGGYMYYNSILKFAYFSITLQATSKTTTGEKIDMCKFNIVPVANTAVAARTPNTLGAAINAAVFTDGSLGLSTNTAINDSGYILCSGYFRLP